VLVRAETEADARRLAETKAGLKGEGTASRASRALKCVSPGNVPCNPSPEAQRRADPARVPAAEDGRLDPMASKVNETTAFKITGLEPDRWMLAKSAQHLGLEAHPARRQPHAPHQPP
jgi:hypothetical protein